MSCSPTGARATGDESLASDGLSLTDDGRVFFNSSDALDARDLDETEDVYEWEPQGTRNCQPESPIFSKSTEACLGLISTGTSAFASSLLGVSSDGADAFFFTRDTLVPQDDNGELAKIYDAREFGGFPFQPAAPPCAASDECHGAGSPTPPPPPIKSIAGEGGNLAPSKGAKCKTGFAEKHDKCLKKHHKPKSHRAKRFHKHRAARRG